MKTFLFFAMMRAEFTKYEAAILLDGLLRVKSGELSRREVIGIVSAKLRQMAVNSGVAIDDTYRNENGISFQMASMESAWEGHTLQKAASKLFREVVAMYRDDQEQYQMLLKGAQNLSVENVQASKGCFMDWLHTQVPSGRLLEIMNAYNEIENFCRKVKVVDASLFELDDYNVAVQVRRATLGNKAFRVTHRKQMALYDLAVHCLCKYYKFGQHSKLEVQKERSTTDKKPQISKSASREIINQPTFAHYLKSHKMSEATCRNYSSAINTCETFAKEHGFSSWRLYTEDIDVARETITLLLKDEDFLAYNAKQHNRFSAALGKFALFVGAEHGDISSKGDASKKTQHVFRNEKYVSVLKESFKKGFRMESPLEIRKFRRYYSELHGCELRDSDNQISSNIRKMCLLYDGKAFLPDVMLSEDLKKSLLHYIEASFASGKQAIYFQALYNEFSEAFLDSHIHDADMLKAYLMHLQLKNVYFSRSYISREAKVEIDPLSEIRNCLQEHVQPMGYEELFSALPHLPQSRIKLILASNGEFINNGQGQYFHESSVILSDEELEDIATIIDEAIEDKEFIGGNELYDAIKAKYPYIIENNATYSVYGFRDALKQKLANRFSFRGNIISHAEQELSMADVFANYAKRHDSFTLTELQSLASELATTIYFEAVYENSLRISKEQFVSKAHAQFPVAETDAAIDRICTGNYIPIQEVTNFGVLPYAGFPWNSFLLEHYVAEFSHKYRLLHSSYNGTECAGAIVKREAGLETFDEFIVDFLANSHIELNKTSALQLLSTNGYLARRRYSNIESLIILANAQRSRKDSD